MNLVCVAQGALHERLATELQTSLNALGLTLRIVAREQHWAKTKLQVLAEASEPTVLLDADLIVREWPPIGGDNPAMATASYRPNWGNSGFVYTPGGEWKRAFSGIENSRLTGPYWDEWVLNRSQVNWQLLPIHWCDTRKSFGESSYIWHPAGRKKEPCLNSFD